jgi:hypothetical protein
MYGERQYGIGGQLHLLSRLCSETQDDVSRRGTLDFALCCAPQLH